MKKYWIVLITVIFIGFALFAPGKKQSAIQTIAMVILVGVTTSYVVSTNAIAKQAERNNELTSKLIERSKELNEISNKALKETAKSNIDKRAPEVQVSFKLLKVEINKFGSSEYAQLGQKGVEVNDADKVIARLEIAFTNIGKSAAIISFAENFPNYLIQYHDWKEKGLLPLILNPSDKKESDFCVVDTVKNWKERESLSGEQQLWHFKGMHYRDSFGKIQDTLHLRALIKPVIFTESNTIAINQEMPINTAGPILNREYPALNKS